MGLNKPGNTSGVSVHNNLTGRTDADGHPMSAITGLVADLNAKATAITSAVSTANSAVTTAGTANTNASEAETKADEANVKIGALTSLATSNKSDLVSAINENFTNANNGKTAIASAVNGKGGSANASMTFTQLADAVTAIPNIEEATGNAVAGDVRSGKTFSNAVGNGIAGTLDLSNLIPGNIKQGVTIDGVAGALAEGEVVFDNFAPVGVQTSESANQGWMADSPDYIVFFDQYINNQEYTVYNKTTKLNTYVSAPTIGGSKIMTSMLIWYPPIAKFIGLGSDWSYNTKMYSVTFDPATGQFTHTQTTDGSTEFRMACVIDFANNKFYTSPSEWRNGSTVATNNYLAEYNINPTTGVLTYVGKYSTGRSDSYSSYSRNRMYITGGYVFLFTFDSSLLMRMNIASKVFTVLGTTYSNTINIKSSCIVNDKCYTKLDMESILVRNLSGAVITDNSLLNDYGYQCHLFPSYDGKYLYMFRGCIRTNAGTQIKTKLSRKAV